MTAPLYTTESGRLWHAGKILVCSVGLPARGKTHVVRSVERYLRWLGVKTEVFSLGDHRRKVLGPTNELPKDYFTPVGRSPTSQALRASVIASLELEIERSFSENRAQVCIMDANNATRVLRKAIRARFEPLGINVMFIENLCDDVGIIERNIRSVKLSSPDYAGWDPEAALKDYLERIEEHKKTYETMNTSGGPFVKVYNVGERIVVHNIQGYLQSRIVFFLMNIHNRYRTIWFARSGLSLIEHAYKADADLAPDGIAYAEKLKAFIIEKRKELQEERTKNGEEFEERDLTIWTSSRRRCVSTARGFADLGKIVERQQMYELNPGVIDGLGEEEIKMKYPQEFEMSQKEPYRHRYPRGESYHDLSVRLEPVILELEREPADVVFIGHASVIRCCLSYLGGIAPQNIPAVEFRRGDVVQVTPSAYGVQITNHSFSY